MKTTGNAWTLHTNPKALFSLLPFTVVIQRLPLSFSQEPLYTCVVMFATHSQSIDNPKLNNHTQDKTSDLPTEMPWIIETRSGISLFERLLKIFLQNAETEDSLTLWNSNKLHSVCERNLAKPTKTCKNDYNWNHNILTASWYISERKPFNICHFIH